MPDNFPDNETPMCDKVQNGMSRSIPEWKHPTTNTLQGGTLDLAISTLWFSCVRSTRRQRLDPSELFDLFGDDI